MIGRSEPRITDLRVAAYRVPTDLPEADGTLEWDATTLVLVELEAGAQWGIGYTYADASLVRLIGSTLAPQVVGQNAMAIGGINQSLWRSVRNLGRSGLVACAISAIDTALWDLKAKLLGLPLVTLLGQCRDQVPVYGSGGFTAYSHVQTLEQVGRWVGEEGCRWIKIKVGAEEDPARVAATRAAIGDAGLFIDANGAFSSRTAIAFAEAVRDSGVLWFEEPVSSDDLAGLCAVRAAVSASGQPMDITAGEYAYTPDDFRQLLMAGALDVMQADVTRCGGISGFLQAAALCEAFHTDLSTHCAPALHRHVACATPRLRHIEWFHDHVRIESMFFDGAPTLARGAIAPDLDQPGHGLTFRQADALRYAIA